MRQECFQHWDMNKGPTLPVREVLTELRIHLEANPNLVLVAPPGAGKTTLVPLALMDAPWRMQTSQKGRIIMLEPRRMAARGAAARMADLLGEPVGQRVGYRVRFDTKVSRDTIIEVVTEGVFIRMLSSDPGLEDVACVIFDEFHERSLDGDMALALALDLQQGLREDLRLLAMSATLDGAAVAKLMQAPVLKSEGRAFPVTIRYRELKPREAMENAMAEAVMEALATEQGDILAFLPGQREIERVAQILASRGAALERFGAHIHRLYGALPIKQQNEAIRPAPLGKRKIVLSSAIAETSLTIEGVTTAIDSGLARKPQFEPSTGLSRLETIKASQAAITQRAGRAGRLGPGVAIRLWREQQTAALPKFDTPEILNADLTGLVLDLAHWGVMDVAQLQWLDAPPIPALQEARNLLLKLEALAGEVDQNGKAIVTGLTAHGRAMTSLPLEPRLAHMVLKASRFGNVVAQRAALLALLVQEGGRSNRVDLSPLVDDALRSNQRNKQSMTSQAQRLLSTLPKITSSIQADDDMTDGVLLGFAFPDRIARRNAGTRDGMVRYKLANGRAADLREDDELAASEFITIVDMMGKAGRARITAAAALSRTALETSFSGLIEEKLTSRFILAEKRLECVQTTQLGEMVLGKPRAVPADETLTQQALDDALLRYGLSLLPWSENDSRLRGRLALLHARLGQPWPAMDDEALLARRQEWLTPFLAGLSGFDNLADGALKDGLMLLAASAGGKREIDALLPSHFTAPSGSNLPLDYGNPNDAVEPDFAPVLRVRPQELFGLKQHPCVMKGKLPLAVELLSPAGRPIQITQDLPGFWVGSWADVRADLRGRYLKHPWPEDPLTAIPTSRAKPRGT